MAPGPCEGRATNAMRRPASVSDRETVLASADFIPLPLASGHTGALSPACVACAEGRKMVLFVTGVCRFRCFYCPVSPTRNQKDVVYANERRIFDDREIVEEARAMDATGTGITGGDPLGCVDRVERFVRLLKGTFGPGHDIHLYTHEPHPAKIERLAAAGLDEVRLHIPHYLWGSLEYRGVAYREVLERAPAWGLRRGVEIPVLPDKERELVRLLRSLERIGVDFVNLNELECSETNEAELRRRGYSRDIRAGWGVTGSRAVAERVIREGRFSVPVHYCSSRFKDGVQLRARLRRRAARTAPPFADRTDDGTVVFGIVEGRTTDDLARLGARIARAAGIGPDGYRVNLARRRVELGARDARRVAARIDRSAFVVEEYPTADALEVEREPLNRWAFSGRRVTGGR